MINFSDDIVRIVDSEDGKGYFAQITAFVTDAYARHYAMIIWLVPKLRSPAGTTDDAQNSNSDHHHHAQFDCFQHGLGQQICKKRS